MGQGSWPDFVGVVDARRSASAPGPDDTLAGLGMALRTVLGLQQLGARRIVVLVSALDVGLSGRLRRDPRVTTELAELEIAEGQAPWARLRAVADTRVLVAGYDWVLDPAVWRELLERQLPKLLGALALRGGQPVGALTAEPALVERLGDEELEQIGRRKDVGRWDIGERWAIRVDGNEAQRRAVRTLFEACRKPVDGFISRHLNRHVSLFISRLLVNTPITPNMMTVVTFSVSLVAAGFALDGSYATTLTAAVLMQLNSILDGCDGELARVRFQGSKLGQWLDTVGDDASNVIFWAALAVGARTAGPYGPWLALAGYVAAGANALAALQNYVLLYKAGSGDFYALDDPDAPARSGPLGALVRFFGVVLKQDFFLMLVLVMAVLGWLHYGLVVMCFGAVLTLGNSSARTLRVWLISRRAGG